MADFRADSSSLPAAPPIARLHHAQIMVSADQVEAARHFYCEVLGLPEVGKPDSLQGRGGLWVRVADQQVHIGVQDDAPRDRLRAHLAYQVADLPAWRVRLAAAGVVIDESVPIPGFDRFECRDPFGNRLEFIQPLS